MTYPLVDLLKMKLNPHSTPQQTSNNKKETKPNPPTTQAIQKAKFVDKTFAWRNDARIRS